MTLNIDAIATTTGALIDSTIPLIVLLLGLTLAIVFALGIILAVVRFFK